MTWTRHYAAISGRALYAITGWRSAKALPPGATVIVWFKSAKPVEWTDTVSARVHVLGTPSPRELQKLEALL